MMYDLGSRKRIVAGTIYIYMYIYIHIYYPMKSFILFVQMFPRDTSMSSVKMPALVTVWKRYSASRIMYICPPLSHCRKKCFIASN